MPKGIIQNRDNFLANIANKLGREQRTQDVSRPEWKHQVQWKVLANHSQDELVDVIEKQCQSIHTDFIRTTESNLEQALLKVILNYGGKSVITWDDPRFDQFGLGSFAKREDLDVSKWDVSNAEQSIRVAEQADIGITFSDITLAESGTVVLFSDNGKGRSVSLLPSTYIAIVPKSTLVPRMSQATREIHQRVQKGEQIATCVNFITGPSNSADIEMNLVVGVHGPIKAAYILVEDK
ncbi:LutC/YkgG family protein [Aquibacillus kalidii]|uniref:LutC/YkgG family protein n=1 Tax=Aquibacillus kalidii TaxID=2762597 RepID=UPI001648470B|nr:lactate utilization protein C [Aquibacillus kalidii]